LKIPCSKLQKIFDRKECGHFPIRSPTPPQAMGLALAVRFNALLSSSFYATARLKSSREYRHPCCGTSPAGAADGAGSGLFFVTTQVDGLKTEGF
jgi:hypothetical protein